MVVRPFNNYHRRLEFTEKIQTLLLAIVRLTSLKKSRKETADKIQCSYIAMLLPVNRKESGHEFFTAYPSHDPLY